MHARIASLAVVVVVLVTTACGGPSVPDEYKAFVPVDGLYMVLPYEGDSRRADLGLVYERKSVNLQRVHDGFADRFSKAESDGVVVLDCAENIEKLGFVIIVVNKDRTKMLSAGARNLTDERIDAILSTKIVGQELPKGCEWKPVAKDVCDPEHFPTSCRIRYRQI
jgi:hypothetical protein